MISSYQPGIFDHIVFLLLAIGLPAVSLSRGKQSLADIHWDTPTKLSLYYSNGLVMLAGAFTVMAIWYFNQRPLAQIGLRPSLIDAEIILWSLLLCGLYAADTIWKLTPGQLEKTLQRQRKTTPFLPSNGKELRHYLFLAFSAGIGEEILFRGFMITYLLALLGNGTMGLSVALIVSAVVFVIGHLYQGAEAVVRIFIGALLFGWIYILSTSLLIPIVIHLIIDLLGGLLAVKYR